MDSIAGSEKRGLRNLLIAGFYTMLIVIGISLLIVFIRFTQLQQEFLDLNFDAVHSTRTLLKTNELVIEAIGELTATANYADYSRLDTAGELIETALAYSETASYYRPERLSALQQSLQRLDTRLKALSIRWQQGDTINQNEVSDLPTDARQIAGYLADLERDRWGMLSALNVELKQRMQRNTLLGVGAGVVFGLLIMALVLTSVYLLRIEGLLSKEKKTLEKEVQQRRDTERALLESNLRFRDLTTLSSDWYWEQDEQFRFTEMSPAFQELMGIPPERYLGKTRWECAHDDLINPDWEAHRAILHAHRPFANLVYQFRDGRDDTRWIAINGKPIFDEGGVFRGYRGVGRDITAAKHSESALFAEKERAQVTLESIGDAVITTDTEGLIQYFNPAAEEVTGWPELQALGNRVDKVVHTVDETTLADMPNPVLPALGQESDHGSQRLLIRRDGSRIPVEYAAAPLLDRDGQPMGVVLVLRDVSHARKMALELSYQATHDALTDLINRREFEYRVEQLIDSGRMEQDRQHTLLYLDLDQFKVVNDTCGHVAGDELLRQISSVLSKPLRANDTLGRLGGDEFGVLLQNCPAEPAWEIAEKLRHSVADFQFVWQDKTFSLGVSIGIVTFGGDGMTLADILSNADTACYIAKDKGRNAIHAYHPEDTELARRHGEMEWLLRLQQALKDERFCLFRQDIASVGDTERGQHFELLIRMLDEHGRLVPPMSFIPAAERYELMPVIDRWTIKTAFARCAEILAKAPHAQLLCAINLSGNSLGDDSFLDYVQAQFGQYGVPYTAICFEITETAAIANLSKAMQFISPLRNLGCRFALDDFGSGMSSFAYLKHLPVDYLKIDGGFVKDMVEDPIDYAMVQAINSIGQVMGIRTIAEFVENDTILSGLKVLGVNYAQGYGIGKPAYWAGAAPNTAPEPKMTAGRT